jgi:hypothetical protein
MSMCTGRFTPKYYIYNESENKCAMNKIYSVVLFFLELSQWWRIEVVELLSCRNHRFQDIVKFRI